MIHTTSTSEQLSKKLEDMGAATATANQLAAEYYSLEKSNLSAIKLRDFWQKIVREYLQDTSIPIACHQYLYKMLCDKYNNGKHFPIWTPSSSIKQNTNLFKFMQDCGNFNSVATFHKWSYENFSDFWQKIITKLNINFRKPYSKIGDFTKIEKPNWLVAAKLNIVDSCFSKDNAQKSAIVWQDENSSKINSISYAELEALVNKIAWAIEQLGLEPNSAIAINMPMHVNAVAIYLAVIKTGHKVVSIADSFAPKEIKTRLDIADTKLIFIQDYILRKNKQIALYQKIADIKAPPAIIIPCTNNPDNAINIHIRAKDKLWYDFLPNTNKNYISKKCNPHDYINILFSSGTTGEPKAIPWDHTCGIKAAADGFLHQDVTSTDIFAWPTNLGWMMGPWLIFASLINNATISLYNGMPHSIGFAKFIEQSKTTILGVVPTLVKYWHSNNILQDVNWHHIKLFTSTAEASNPNEMFWLAANANYKPIIEYCGGTEIAGGYITSTLLDDNIPSSFSTPAMGINFCMLDDNNKIANKGEVALIPPSIGLSRELLNKNHHEVYYKGMPIAPSGAPLRRHGDAIAKLANGYFQTLGRVDDTMNLGGIKISSVEIETVIAKLEEIVESAAIAVEPQNGGTSSLVIYAVHKSFDKSENKIKIATQSEYSFNENKDTLKKSRGNFSKNKYNTNENQHNSSNNEVKSTEYLKSLQEKMQKLIKQELNPLFKISALIFIDKLPRTSSNKIMRRVLREKFIQDYLTTT